AKHLQFIAGKEKISLAPAAAHAIARGAEGGLRDAESMLDQLVAFCGEKISENDVLDVFGFTSEQTVVDLTGRILRAETPGAIDLLHQQRTQPTRLPLQQPQSATAATIRARHASRKCLQMSSRRKSGSTWLRRFPRKDFCEH